MSGSKPHILAQRERVLLRDALKSDVEIVLRWQTTGEWRNLDAPWEGVREEMTPSEVEIFRKTFIKSLGKDLPKPRQRAVIALTDQVPIGWVTRYAEKRFPDVWYVGIDICEDACLNRGLGSEALKLWVRYLFENSTIHKVGLDTWSFNPRMRRAAQKAGFEYEGTERELLGWKGERLGLDHFGLLRDEWDRLGRSKT